MREPEFLPNIDLKMKEESLSIIKKYRFDAKEISLRTLIQTTKIRSTGRQNWEQMAKYVLVA